MIIVYNSYLSADPKIKTFPDEYDSYIPTDISLAEYILQEIEKFGDTVSSVSCSIFLLLSN